MKLKKQPLTDKELEAWENSRDLGAELLESVCQMKAGERVHRHVASHFGTEKIGTFRGRICQTVWRISTHLARLGTTPPQSQWCSKNTDCNSSAPS